MATENYVWRVNHLVTKDTDARSKVVTNVHISVMAQDAGFIGTYDGHVDIPEGDIANVFTDFDSLSEQQVMTWVMATLSVDTINMFMRKANEELQAQLSTLPRVSTYLPWNRDWIVADAGKIWPPLVSLPPNVDLYNPPFATPPIEIPPAG